MRKSRFDPFSDRATRLPLPRHRRQPRGRRRPRPAILAVVTVLGLLAVPVSAIADTSTGSALFKESFTHNTVSSENFSFGGTLKLSDGTTTSYTPCLTAGGGDAGPVLTSCSGTTDGDGSGALRLTDSVKNEAGYVLYNKALPTSGGIDITFTQYQYSGTGADGISFFLTDGQYDLTTPGPSGGSLGYNGKAASTDHSTIAQPGLAHGLLGVGIDAYGNFTAETNSADCTAVRPASTNPGNYTDTIAVRGPAGPDGMSGYCLLGQPKPVVGGVDESTSTTRPAGHQVRIVVDPPANATPQVNVYWGGSATPLVTVPEPDTFASVKTFKFGWAASTGGSYDIHEISMLDVSTVTPLDPAPALTTSTTVISTTAGAKATIPFTPEILASGGPLENSATFSATLPDGLVLDADPSGVGWDCAGSAGRAVTCTYDAGTTSVPPGTALPLSVPVISGTGTTAASGKFTVTGNFTAAAVAVQASANVEVKPVAAAVPPVNAKAGETITIDPDAGVGTGLVYSLVVPTDGADGTVSIDPKTGQITFKATADHSGTSTFDYQVTDEDSLVSAAVTVTVNVRPAAEDGSISTDYGTAAALDLSTLAAGTSLSYAVDSTGTDGSVTLARANATFVPADGFSGVTTFDYTATDSAGLSGTAAVTVTVRPTVLLADTAFGLDEHAEGSVTTAAAMASGTGPFTYAVSTDPAVGTASIAADGRLTYTAATGESGVFTVGYTVTGASDVASAEELMTVTVTPYAASPAGTTTVGHEVTVSPTGIGDQLTWAIDTPPAHGTATIDIGTGAVTYTPADSWSGVDSVIVIATDTDGIASDPVTVTLNVLPVTDDVSADGAASLTPPSVLLTPSPTGTAPAAGWLYTITSPLDAELGTAQVATDGIRITPKPGVSGVLQLSYTATAADNLQSAPATATLIVAPAADAAAFSIDSGTSGGRTLPKPVGAGPFRWMLRSVPSPSRAAVTLDPDTGRMQVQASRAFSGPVKVQYTVTGADGVTSAPSTATINVLPVAGDPYDVTTKVVVPGTPGTPVSTTVPVPAGSGPFIYALSAVSAADGTATLDPATGDLTFAPAPGRSGRVTVAYQAADASGNTTKSSVVILISPAAIGTTVPVSTQFLGQVSYTPAIPTGTAPFTYRIETPLSATQGTATIDPQTGVITFFPAVRFRGAATVGYVVVDADGIVSPSADVTFEIPEPPAEPVSLPNTGLSIGLVPVGFALLLVLSGGLLLFARRRRTA